MCFRMIELHVLASQSSLTHFHFSILLLQPFNLFLSCSLIVAGTNFNNSSVFVRISISVSKLKNRILHFSKLSLTNGCLRLLGGENHITTALLSSLLIFTASMSAIQQCTPLLPLYTHTIFWNPKFSFKLLSII